MLRLLKFLFAIFCVMPLPLSADDHVSEGRALYFQHCAVCHGQDARGGHIIGDTAVPDLTRIADRRDSVWPMLEIMSIIDGYTKATEPRADLPVVDVLTQGPQVEFETGNGRPVRVPANLLALVNYLESIQLPRPDSYVP